MAQLFRKSVDESDNEDSPQMPKSFIADEDAPKAPKSFIADSKTEEVPKKPSVFSRMEKYHPPLDKEPQSIDTKGQSEKVNKREDTNVVGFDQAKWSDIASKLPEKWHGLPVRYPAAFVGSLAGTALESLSSPENIAAMGAGVAIKPEESQIRPPMRTDFSDRPTNYSARPLTNTTPQQDSVAIAQTRDNIPRTAPNISTETGIPQPSVRRTVRELDTKTAPQERVPVRITDELPIRQADKLRNDPYEFAGESIDTAPDKPRDFGYNKQDSENLPRTPTAITPKSFIADTAEEAPKEKPNFVNPFEKPAEEKPTAKYVFTQPGFEDIPDAKMYNVSGGEYDKSTVGEERLKQLGIDIPPSEEPEFKLPSYNKDVSDTRMNELQNKFGGTQEEPSIANDKLKYTIENAPPNQRAIMQRGAHEPVNILFDSPEDREVFGAGQRAFSKGMIKPGVLQRLDDSSNRIAKDLNITPQEARGYISDYNATVRKLGSAVDPNGGNITAPSFKEFVQSKISSSNEPEEMSGGLGGIKPPKQQYPKFQGPAGPALDKLFNTMGGTLEKRLQQDVLNKVERAKRFAKAASIKGGGMEGAAKRLSAMRGEFKKIEPSEGMQLDDKEVSSLFDAVDNAKITQEEKLKGSTGLFALLNGDRIPQRNELAILDEVFGNSFASRVTEMHGGLGAVGIKLGKVSNTMKSMLNSVNVAAPLLHGLPMANRPEFREAAANMIKFMGDKEAYNAAMQAIEDRPGYTKWREAGLFTAKPETLASGEEDFANSYVGAMPGIRNIVATSKRGYVGFLNELRSKVADNLEKNITDMGETVFEKSDHVNTEDMAKVKRLQKFARDNDIPSDINHPDFINLAKKNGMTNTIETPTKLAKDLAKVINTFTDRGSLGKLEKIAPELNYALCSPRRLAARFTMLNPKFYIDLEPAARTEALKMLFSQAAAGTTLVTLGVLAGGKTSMDPSNPDFMKVRFGNSVLNPLGPTQSVVYAAAKAIGELHRLGEGRKAKFGEQSIPEIGVNLLRNRESPIVRLADSVASARQFTKDSKEGDISTLSPPESGGFINRFGDKKYISSEVRNSFTPIFVQNVHDLLTTDDSFAKSIGLGAASFVGLDDQTIPEKKPKGSLMLRKPQLR